MNQMTWSPNYNVMKGIISIPAVLKTGLNKAITFAHFVGHLFLIFQTIIMKRQKVK